MKNFHNYEIFKHQSRNIIFTALFTIVLLFSQYTSSKLFESGYSSYTAIFFISCIASIVLLVKSIQNKGYFKFSLIDLSFLTFSIFLILRWIVSDNSWLYSKGAIAFSIISIYFFVKQFSSTYLIHWSIIITGTIQISISILQQTGYLLNINPSFTMGGTFGNPNILAMMLLLTIPSAFFCYYNTNYSFLKYATIYYYIIVLLLIIFTKCRSAIFGSMLVGIFIIFNKNSVLAKGKTKILWLGILGLTFGGFIFLIIEKLDSLIGRVLIWQSSIVKIIEKPLWGHGISSFHNIYPEAQRNFLETNSIDPYIKIAGSPQWAYNDFIEFWIEGGAIISLTFIVLLITIIYCWKTQNRFNISLNNTAFLSTITFFILCTVNFAFTAWPVLLIFMINLAWCSRVSHNITKFKISYILKLASVVFLLCGNILLSIDAYRNLKFLYEFKNINEVSIDKQESFYLKSKEKYTNYAPFVHNYALLLCKENNHKEALYVLNELNKYAPSYNTNYQLAEIYLELSNIKMARFHFKKSAEFLPNKIQPHLQLYYIEITENKFNKADSIKAWILSHEFKGEEKFISQIKETLSFYNKPKNN